MSKRIKSTEGSLPLHVRPLSSHLIRLPQSKYISNTTHNSGFLMDENRKEETSQSLEVTKELKNNNNYIFTPTGAHSRANKIDSFVNFASKHFIDLSLLRETSSTIQYLYRQKLHASLYLPPLYIGLRDATTCKVTLMVNTEKEYAIEQVCNTLLPLDMYSTGSMQRALPFIPIKRANHSRNEISLTQRGLVCPRKFCKTELEKANHFLSKETNDDTLFAEDKMECKYQQNFTTLNDTSISKNWSETITEEKNSNATEAITSGKTPAFEISLKDRVKVNPTLNKHKFLKEFQRLMSGEKKHEQWIDYEGPNNAFSRFDFINTTEHDLNVKFKSSDIFPWERSDVHCVDQGFVRKYMLPFPTMIRDRKAHGKTLVILAGVRTSIGYEDPLYRYCSVDEFKHMMKMK